MKKLIIILTAAVFVVSCTKNLEDLNQNIKDPTKVTGESLFASAQKRLADQMLTPNVNLNNNRLWVQHWNETTYQDESNYDQLTRAIPDRHWQVMYRDVLKNLDEAARVIEETDNPLTNAEKANKLAIIEILSIYAWSNLVETYGDIPYTEALDIENTLPAYDDAETVYRDLISRLSSALSSMDSNGSFPGTDDLIYNGDVDSWSKFGNTLKLRMAMVMADVDAGLAQSTAESAVQAGVFASNDDTAAYQYSVSAPNNNPVNNNLVLSGRNDYVAAQTLVDVMNELKDPRRAEYFDPNINGSLGEVASVSSSGGVTTITFTASLAETPIIGNNAYAPDAPEVPLRIGTITGAGSDYIEIEDLINQPETGAELFFAKYEGAKPGKQSRYADFSHANRTMVAGDAPGVILSYIEAEFLMAEAAARGYAVGGSAKDHYDAGIEASFEYWGATGLSDYMANPEVDYDSALANSSSNPAWKEVIGTQAWIALYNRTFAPYLTIRRLDYPLLVEPDKAQTGFPVRYTYPTTERNLNQSNYNAAASAIGGDEAETRLFWDKFYTFDF